MKVALGFPFWGDQPERVRNLQFIQKTVYGMFPFHFVTSVIPEGHHNRGAARNWLARWALENGADVVVLNDADTFPEQHGLLAAINGAYDHGGLHFAFDRYRMFTEDATNQILAGNYRSYDDLPISLCSGALGGIMAIRPQQWFDAGASPELIGWGFEDVIFAVQARTLLRDNEWHPGWASHIYHPTEVAVGSESYERNIAICKRYERVSGDPEGIRRLIAER